MWRHSLFLPAFLEVRSACGIRGESFAYQVLKPTTGCGSPRNPIGARFDAERLSLDLAAHAVAQRGLLCGHAALTWSRRCFHSCLRLTHDHWRP